MKRIVLIILCLVLSVLIFGRNKLFRKIPVPKDLTEQLDSIENKNSAQQSTVPTPKISTTENNKAEPAAEILAPVIRNTTVASAQGEVKIKTKDKDWLNITSGTALDKGDILKTGKKSEAEIAFDQQKNNMLKIGELTTVLFKEIGEKFKVVELSSGKLFTSVSNLARDEKFEVHTPVAISGARGTGWSTTILNNGAEFSAFSNQIEIQSLNKDGKIVDEITLSEGFKVFVDEFGKIEGIKELNDKDIKGWERWQDTSVGTVEALNEIHERNTELNELIKTTEEIRSLTVDQQNEDDEARLEQEQTISKENTLRQQPHYISGPGDDR